MSYQSRALERLELPKVLTRLENLCACNLGRTRVRALSPTHANVEARRRLASTSEARRFIEAVRFPPFGGITDVSESLKYASIGSLLDPEPLLHIGRAAEGMRRLRETIRGIEPEKLDEFPLLLDLTEGIFPRPDLEKAIAGAIDDNSEIKDDASLDLLKARRNIRQTQSQIQTRLRQMLSDTRVTPHLQDAFVTVRDGRYCLPVKSESRSSVPGIVHDRSNSGAAVFIEPQAVIELNNRLRELASEERDAMLDILKALSAHVGGAADELERSLDAAGELDFAFAKAQLSERMEAIEPELRDNLHGWKFTRARHPLVEGCVPNDISLGEESAVTERGDFDVMMLTGPNTGGKTVVLKTLGLLTAMVGCGLHIPVDEGSWLHLPPEIHVDIGDEQSIEQSLSTFSGHLKNIVGILKTVQEHDLVLFDEIGAGTDPDEGAALAKAVLRTLSRRGARVVATTHYGELKQFALSAQRFENASVEFDPKTLKPTYALRIGVPGASNALDIAARLGMPGDIVQRARRYLGTDRVEAEAAAQRLEETQRELTQQTEEARRERSEVEKLRRDYEARIQRVEQDNKREIARARKEARELVETASKEADAALRELRQAARGSSGQGSASSGENKGTEQARGRLRTLRERVAAFNETAEVKVPMPTVMAPRFEDPTPMKEVRVGDIVLVRSFDKEAEVLKVENERAEVRIGAMKVTVKFSDLQPTRQKLSSGGMVAIQSRKSWNIPPELNIIGQNTEEALDGLTKYLDDALLAGLREVRIVHGRGSGALRTAVHRFLKGFRQAQSYELAAQSEGGEGATVVKLG